MLTRQQAEETQPAARRAVRTTSAGFSRRAELEPDDLARLARDIAQRASDPVSAELIRHFAGLQQDFNEQILRGAVRRLSTRPSTRCHQLPDMDRMSPVKRGPSLLHLAVRDHLTIRSALEVVTLEVWH